MTRKIKAKANAMVDADVNFISLVSRPASRIPFRLTKSDDDTDHPEAGLMIHLKNMFKRDGDALQGCTLVGIVMQKQHVDHLAPQIKELGLKIDDRSEADGVVILKQANYAEDAVTAIKLGEVGGLFINVPDVVRKGFDPFTESDDFDENMALSFLPGMSAATEALFDTVIQVLRNAESPEDAKSRIEANIDKYKSTVMDMAGNLPTIAFKLAGLSLDGFVTKEEGEAAETDETAEVTDAAAGEVTDAAAAAEGEVELVVAEPTVADAGDEAAAITEVEKSAPEAGLTDAEKLKLKGVHIENLDVVDAPADASDEAATATAAKVDKNESSETDGDIVAILAAFKSEVLGAISSVKSEVTELKSKQAALTEKVNTAAAIAERAQKAVKGTVPSNSDADDRVRDESLGTRSRHKGEEASDERTWGGTALDRIVGDFGTGG